MRKPLLIKRSGLIVLLFLVSRPGVGQQDTARNHPGAEDAHKVGVFHLVKLYPSFAGFEFRGGGVAYETGAGVFPFSVSASLRYFDGSLPIGLLDTVPRHLRFEVQYRWWPIYTFRALFGGLLFNVNSSGGVSAGGLVGYHVFISKQVVAEASIGIQSGNRTISSGSPIILRYGLSLGLVFPKMLRYGYPESD